MINLSLTHVWQEVWQIKKVELFHRVLFKIGLTFLMQYDRSLTFLEVESRFNQKFAKVWPILLKNLHFYTQKKHGLTGYFDV